MTIPAESNYLINVGTRSATEHNWRQNISCISNVVRSILDHQRSLRPIGTWAARYLRQVNQPRWWRPNKKKKSRRISSYLVVSSSLERKILV